MNDITFTSLYTWLKAAHAAAAMVFVSGTLLDAVVLRAPSLDARAFILMVRQWDRRVTVPAMLLTWTFGLTLGLIGGWFTSLWLIAKLVLVFALSGLHGVLSARLRAAGNGAATPTLSWPAPIVLGCVICIVMFAITKI